MGTGKGKPDREALAAFSAGGGAGRILWLIGPLIDWCQDEGRNGSKCGCHMHWLLSGLEQPDDVDKPTPLHPTGTLEVDGNLHQEAFCVQRTPNQFGSRREQQRDRTGNMSGRYRCTVHS